MEPIKKCISTNGGICCGKIIPPEELVSDRLLCKSCYNLNRRTKRQELSSKSINSKTPTSNTNNTSFEEVSGLTSENITKEHIDNLLVKINQYNKSLEKKLYDERLIFEKKISELKEENIVAQKLLYEKMDVILNTISQNNPVSTPSVLKKEKCKLSKYIKSENDNLEEFEDITEIITKMSTNRFRDKALKKEPQIETDSQFRIIIKQLKKNKNSNFDDIFNKYSDLKSIDDRKSDEDKNFDYSEILHSRYYELMDLIQESQSYDEDNDFS